MDYFVPRKRNADGALIVSEPTKERAIAWIAGLEASMQRSYAEKVRLRLETREYS